MDGGWCGVVLVWSGLVWYEKNNGIKDRWRVVVRSRVLASDLGIGITR